MAWVVSAQRSGCEEAAPREECTGVGMPRDESYCDVSRNGERMAMGP